MTLACLTEFGDVIAILEKSKELGANYWAKIVEYQQVLSFWFGKTEDIIYGKPHKFWFVKSEEFDLKFKSQFQSLYKQAAAYKLTTWQEQPLSCLALIEESEFLKQPCSSF